VDDPLAHGASKDRITSPQSDQVILIEGTHDPRHNIPEDYLLR
jgi:hypothetical protein